MGRIFETFLHLFTPRHTNNHKAKVLHLSSLYFYIAALLIFQIGLTVLARYRPEVLSYATNVTVQDLLKGTNAMRLQNGVATLELNDKLSQAAKFKAEDMFANQYWAHTSPTGKDPWSFIQSAGYNYLYAGENLARDFADSEAVVNAWMNSPTHKENLINARYKEVGFAVANGKYGSYETTVVVQMFGTKPNSPATVFAPQNPTSPVVTPTVVNPPAPVLVSDQKPVVVAGLTDQAPKSKFDFFAITRAVSLVFTVLLMVFFAVDAFLLYRRKAVRVSGHNFAHLMFLLVLLVALNLIGRGSII